VERQAALISLRAEVGALALDLASSIIGEALRDDKKSVAIVDRFLADLDADTKAKAGQ
jgi:F-type H+-transporting ATPase subunit b